MVVVYTLLRIIDHKSALLAAPHWFSPRISDVVCFIPNKRHTGKGISPFFSFFLTKNLTSVRTGTCAGAKIKNPHSLPEGGDLGDYGGTLDSCSSARGGGRTHVFHFSTELTFSVPFIAQWCANKLTRKITAVGANIKASTPIRAQVMFGLELARSPEKSTSCNCVVMRPSVEATPNCLWPRALTLLWLQTATAALMRKYEATSFIPQEPPDARWNSPDYPCEGYFHLSNTAHLTIARQCELFQLEMDDPHAFSQDYTDLRMAVIFQREGNSPVI